MTLSLELHVRDRFLELAGRLDERPTLGDSDAVVVGAVREENRRIEQVDVRDRRAVEKLLPLGGRIAGVAGGSHGGYATMRALTFPPETNGRGEGYDFGFGMSHAGFSSIVSFYDATNIPDWIILEVTCSDD